MFGATWDDDTFEIFNGECDASALAHASNWERNVTFLSHTSCLVYPSSLAHHKANSEQDRAPGFTRHAGGGLALTRGMGGKGFGANEAHRKGGLWR